MKGQVNDSWPGTCPLGTGQRRRRGITARNI